MPPPVCQDSEDEDDPVIFDPLRSQRSTFSWAAREAEAVLAQPESPINLDGATDCRLAKISSYDLLDQTYDVERGLFGTTSASSKANRDLQRRASAGSNISSVGPAKDLGWIDSAEVETANSLVLSKDAQSRGRASAFIGNGQSSVTSQSACPIGNAGPPDVAYKTTGGMFPREFIDHEPNIMFRDTGTTVAFNESSQQRAIEQVKHDINISGSGATCTHAAASEGGDMSSFPWSVSLGPTQSFKGNQHNDAQSAEHSKFQSVLIPLEHHEKISEMEMHLETRAEATRHIIDVDEERNEDRDPDNIVLAQKRPKSSPIIEIPRYTATADRSIVDAPPTQPKESRGRRRVVRDKEQDEDPLDSDDPHIGLPKEQYKPRPSRRRATEAIEPPIDYSIVPEKAARKRRKTANALCTVDGKIEQWRAGSVPSHELHESHAQPVERPAKPRPCNKSPTFRNHENPEKVNGRSEQNMTIHSADKHVGQLISMGNTTSDVKTMAPPPLAPPSSKKGRRSKTTIFEDHIQAPNLSQQQAMRRSALTEISPSSPRANRRKRMATVEDDDDEEDELAQPDHEVEESVPQKRGRPAKGTKKSKSVAHVVDDSESEDNLAEQTKDDGGPPRKPGRGRPRKIRSPEPPNRADSPATPAPISLNQSPDTDPTKLGEYEQATGRPPDGLVPQQEPLPVTDPPTLPGLENPPLSEPASKPSPTSHSPLKSSSLVPLRVGLSKKRKIPSLLKSFRPPPKQSTR